MVQQACAQRGHDNRQTGDIPGSRFVFALALEALQLNNYVGFVCSPHGSDFFKKVYKMYFNSPKHKCNI